MLRRAGIAADLSDDWLLTGTHGFQLVETVDGCQRG
jgi:hypothetical protein